MKKIVVISDTHGNVAGLEKIRGILTENDVVIHCGDGCKDLSYFPEIKESYFVRGNCDGLNRDEKVIELEGKKILILHGHNHGVKGGLTRLKYYAQEKGVDVVFYGHTHKASIVEADGITFINPGNLSRYSANKSYCYVVISGDKLTSVIVPVI